MRLLNALVFVFLLSAGSLSQDSASSRPPAQQEPQTVLKATTRLVVVDVVATDSQGAPVTDLKESDLVILEDGRPQRLGSFSFQGASAKTEPPPQLPQDVVTSVPRSSSNSLNVILLDRINGESSNRVYAQDRLVKYLESGVTIEPTAVFIMEKKLTLVHDFTTDTRVLKNALNSVRPTGVSRVLGVDVAASPYATKGDFHTDENAIEVTLRSLRLLARTLAGYPGRKNLIWVSEAFPVNLRIEGVPTGSSLNPMIIARGPASGGSAGGADANAATTRQQETTQAQAQGGASSNVPLNSGRSFEAELAKIADALMDAHVALYPVDAAGVGLANRQAAQSNMRDMADRTGGRAFYNRNDIEVGIGSSINDGSIYYALSYYPDNHQWDGRFRRIEIKTSRPGVSLRYRMGYYAVNSEDSDKRNSDELAQEFAYAMGFDSPLFAGIRFQARITPPADKSQKAMVSFAIDPHSITFESKDDGLQHVAVSCSVAVYTEKGNPVKGARDEITTMSGALKPDEYQRMMRQYFPCKRTLDLKPGKYLLRLGAVDRNSHLLGTSNASLIVP